MGRERPAAPLVRPAMAEIKPPLLVPEFLPFHGLVLVDAPPKGPGWGHEIKYDGYRVQLRVHAGKPTIWTRNKHDWTDRFPALAKAAARLPDCIVDGELCAIGPDGKPDFSALRSAIAKGKTDALVLFAFDILYDEVDDLRGYALPSRKARLRKVLDKARVTPAIAYVEHFDTPAAAMFRQACALGLEGMVSKRLDQPYRAGKSGDWQKAKCRPAQEVVIGGWRSEGVRFQALFAGVYEAGSLRYAGSIKTGFPADVVHDLERKLAKLEQPTTPFVGAQPERKGERHWCRPELVAQVEFAEWTASGKLRQSSFKGLREDKEAREVVRESSARA
jgi:bifunctional non-homologous end joining protein LigD